MFWKVSIIQRYSFHSFTRIHVSVSLENALGRQGYASKNNSSISL